MAAGTKEFLTGLFEQRHTNKTINSTTRMSRKKIPATIKPMAAPERLEGSLKPVLLVVVAVVTAVLSELVLSPRDTELPSDVDCKVEEVELLLEEEFVLLGLWFGGRRGGVVSVVVIALFGTVVISIGALVPSDDELSCC